MRRGITQDQVTSAADALVVAGDKPTVEKVRARLGTGSPNTITRMLDLWRQGLAERLQDALSLPELPADVGKVMASVWRLAVDHAHGLAQTGLQQEREALEVARAQLEQAQAQLSLQLREADAAHTRVELQLSAAVQHAVDLEARLAEAQQQTDEVRTQRDRLQQQADQWAAEIERLNMKLAALQTASVSERERHDAHVRAVEDRAHHEVDRARQELKALRTDLGAEKRDHLKVQAEHERERATLQRALREAEARAAQHAGHAAALEAAMARLQVVTQRKKKTGTPRRHAAPARKSSLGRSL